MVVEEYILESNRLGGFCPLAPETGTQRYYDYFRRILQDYGDSVSRLICEYFRRRNFRIQDVSGDKSCFNHAADLGLCEMRNERISVSLDDLRNRAIESRSLVIQMLRKNPEIFAGNEGGETLENYCSRMSLYDTEVDHVYIFAYATCYNVKVVVMLIDSVENVEEPKWIRFNPHPSVKQETELNGTIRVLNIPNHFVSVLRSQPECRVSHPPSINSGISFSEAGCSHRELMSHTPDV